MAGGEKGQVEVCSTPEGIEGGRTLLLKHIDYLEPECSTPEGIEGGRTPQRRQMFTAPFCAQRPRASKGVARGDRVSAIADMTGCSTPEGIEGGRTLRPFPAR